jgi:hypothetical protein
MPNSSPNPYVHQGTFDQSVVNDILSCTEQQIAVSTTVVSLTNPTVATDMMTAVLQPNTLSAPNKVLQVFAAGTYNLGAASTVVFTIKLGGVTIATFTTASQATTAVTLGWQVQFAAAVVTAGPVGTLEVHGELNFDSGATLAAACSTFLDSNTAVSSAINLAAISTLEIMANLGTGNAGSVIAQRLLEVELYN